MKNLIPAEVVSYFIIQKDSILDEANSTEFGRYLGRNYFDGFERILYNDSKTYRLFIRTDCADIADDEKALVMEVYSGYYPDSKDFVDEVTLIQTNLNGYFDLASFVEALKENECA